MGQQSAVFATTNTATYLKVNIGSILTAVVTRGFILWVLGYVRYQVQNFEVYNYRYNSSNICPSIMSQCSLYCIFSGLILRVLGYTIVRILSIFKARRGHCKHFLGLILRVLGYTTYSRLLIMRVLGSTTVSFSGLAILQVLGGAYPVFRTPWYLLWLLRTLRVYWYCPSILAVWPVRSIL